MQNFEEIVLVLVNEKTGVVRCSLRDREGLLSGKNPYGGIQVYYEGREAKRFLHWYRREVERQADPEDCWDDCFVKNVHGVFDNDKVEACINRIKRQRGISVNN